MAANGHTEYDHAEYQHTEDERAEDEHTEDEPAEDEHTASEAEEDDHTDDEHFDDEGTDDESTEYDHTEYEPGEYDEHTVFHTHEARLSGPTVLLMNQLKGPQFRMVQLSAKSGQALGMARAKVVEKLSHAGSTIEYGAYTVTHPLHPARRRAARDAHRQQIKLASDRRKQRVGVAKSNAAAKIAKAREGRIEILEEGVH